MWIETVQPNELKVCSQILLMLERISLKLLLFVPAPT